MADVFFSKLTFYHLLGFQVNCKHCQFELGGQVPFGPNGTNLIAFGTEKVVEKKQNRKVVFISFLAGEGVGTHSH